MWWILISAAVSLLFHPFIELEIMLTHHEEKLAQDWDRDWARDWDWGKTGLGLGLGFV